MAALMYMVPMVPYTKNQPSKMYASLTLLHAVALQPSQTPDNIHAQKTIKNKGNCMLIF